MRFLTVIPVIGSIPPRQSTEGVTVTTQIYFTLPTSRTIFAIVTALFLYSYLLFCRGVGSFHGGAQASRTLCRSAARQVRVGLRKCAGRGGQHWDNAFLAYCTS